MRPDAFLARENDFVRVSGQLKVFGHKRYINATHVRKIVDFHEVYYHLLEVMAVTRTLEVGPVRVSCSAHCAPRNTDARFLFSLAR